MLAIRMQRTGRKGHAMFRMVVQDSRLTPTSGRVVASLGHYDPHTKAVSIEKELATKFLNNGAQPSERVARLLVAEGIALPSWVKMADTKSRTIRNPEKLRRNQPKEETVPEEPTTEVVAEESPATAVEAEAPTDTEA